MDYKKGKKWEGPNFKVQGKRIPKVKSYQYLGIEINPMLDWEKVREVWDGKIRRKLKVIDELAVNLLVKVQLVHWIVVPIIKYGMEIVDYKQWLERWDKLIWVHVRKWQRKNTLSVKSTKGQHKLFPILYYFLIKTLK